MNDDQSALNNRYDTLLKDIMFNDRRGQTNPDYANFNPNEFLLPLGTEADSPALESIICFLTVAGMLEDTDEYACVFWIDNIKLGHGEKREQSLHAARVSILRIMHEVTSKMEYGEILPCSMDNLLVYMGVDVAHPNGYRKVYTDRNNWILLEDRQDPTASIKYLMFPDPSILSSNFAEFNSYPDNLISEYKSAISTFR